MDIKQLCENLTKFHWSPAVPEHYVIQKSPDNPAMAGVGLVAKNNYAAFNLAWADCGGQWKTIPDQRKMVERFTTFSGVTEAPLGGGTVFDWVCLLQPLQFMGKLEADKGLPNPVKAMLHRATIIGIQLQGYNDIRRV